eukprot:851143_1
MLLKAICPLLAASSMFASHVKSDISQDPEVIELVNNLWHKYDVNGNGILDLNEIHKMWSIDQQFDEANFKASMDDIDKDLNGHIDKSEMANFFVDIKAYVDKEEI